MHCQMLLYATEIGDFLQVRIHLLIGIYREYRVISPAHRVVTILFDQLQRIIKQGHEKLNFGLLSLLVYSLSTVRIFGDMLGAQVIDIDKRQACITAEDKYISHHIEALDAKILITDSIYLLDS